MGLVYPLSKDDIPYFGSALATGLELIVNPMFSILLEAGAAGILYASNDSVGFRGALYGSAGFQLKFF